MGSFFSYFIYIRFAILSTILTCLIALTVPFQLAIEPGLGKMLYEKCFFTLDTYLLYKYLGIQFFLLLTGALLSIFYSLHETNISISITNAIRKKTLRNLFRVKLRFFTENDTGFVIKRLVDDTQAVASGITSIITIGTNIMVVVCIGTILYIIGDWLCYSYCIMLVISIVWILFWLKPIQAYNSRIGAQYSELYSFYFEVFSGIKEIKINNLYGFISRKLYNISGKMKRTNVITTILYSLLYQLSFFFPMAFYAALLVVGLRKIEAGEFTIGLLLGMVAILWEIYQPVQRIFSVIDHVQSGIAAAVRLKALKNAPREASGKLPFNVLQNNIEFRNVSFSYSEKESVLDKCSFTVRRGSKTAIVGRSGSGKSTICNLLLNLSDGFQGSVLLDGIPLHQYTLSTLREKVVFVTQDIHLFDCSIRNNIDVNCRMHDHEISDILTKVNLHELVASLPLGMDTMLGKDGFNLSGGEKQRLAVARLFACEPEIVVLDEISSALDKENEHKLIEEIMNFSRNRTVISVSHRLMMIMGFDTIFVVKNGQIVEMGSREQLLEKEGEFCAIFNTMDV